MRAGGGGELSRSPGVGSAMKTVLLCLLVAGATARATGAAPLERVSWTVGGVTRTALVHFPDRRENAPLILAFHGHGGTMGFAARRFALERLWPEAIVVYPQGLPSRTPNDPQGRRAGWSLVPLRNRDLEWVDAILETARTDWKTDPRRVFSMGHSNGAAFTYLLWGNRPDTFAAVASVAGAGARLIARAQPCPVMHIGGKADTIVRFEDQEKVVAAARQVNGASAPVEFVVHDGGHAYPGDASRRIVAFFRRHTRPVDKADRSTRL